MLSWVKKTLGSEPQLFIDHKRINPEIQRERRRELDGSLERRRRIMDRMILGYSCKHPSWVADRVTQTQQDPKRLAVVA